MYEQVLPCAPLRPGGALTNPSPLLYIFGGLPGTGKSALSRELARQRGAVHLRFDTIEQNPPRRWPHAPGLGRLRGCVRGRGGQSAPEPGGGGRLREPAADHARGVASRGGALRS
jgi:hypothetical protein